MRRSVRLLCIAVCGMCVACLAYAMNLAFTRLKAAVQSFTPTVEGLLELLASIIACLSAGVLFTLAVMILAMLLSDKNENPNTDDLYAIYSLMIR
ncbi:MAG: hypothetical protein DRJ67_05170 [Thermoprotei archaeon]|nr:MAG: hypothetical protein DRJ67_05170 [Thermoprotei archaeon]